MSNEERYAAVAYSAKGGGTEFGVFDRETGRVAGLIFAGSAIEVARDLNGGKANYFGWQPADSVIVTAALVDKPERFAPRLRRFEERRWDCAALQLGANDYIKVGRVSNVRIPKVSIQCVMGDDDAVVIVSQDDAVDFANAVLEAAGLDARVEEV